MGRSSKVAPFLIEKVKESLKRNGYPSQKAFAREAVYTRSTVNRFLNGQPVDNLTFIELCEKLGLDWQEFADREYESQSPEDIDDGETRWVGREDLIAKLIANLQGDTRILSLVGITGIGKTSLAAKLTREPQLQGFQLKIVRFLEESPDFQVVAQRLLGEKWANQPQLRQDENALVRAMVAQLESRPCLLVLDMLEAVLAADGKGGHRFTQSGFAKFLDAVVLAGKMRSRIILTSQDRPPVCAEGRFPQRCHTEEIKGLELSVARQLFALWEVEIKTDADRQYLDRMISVYEGHPLGLRVIAGEIRSHRYGGNIQAFWQEYGGEIAEVERLKTATEGNPREDKQDLTFSIDLKELVLRRIKRCVSRLQEDDPLAYRLFCMGAIHRQAEPREAWLFLIGEESREAQKLAFEMLQRRFLLEEECRNGKVFYRLHSLIRGVALEHLRAHDTDV